MLIAVEDDISYIKICNSIYYLKFYKDIYVRFLKIIRLWQVKDMST